MLTTTQRNAIFTNLTKTFTVDGNSYTAHVTYPEEFNGVQDTPVILLNYISEGIPNVSSVGNTAVRDTSLLSIDVLSYDDTTNGVNRLRLTQEIARTLLDWCINSADAALIDHGLKITENRSVRNMSREDEKIGVMHFEVYVLYLFV